MILLTFPEMQNSNFNALKNGVETYPKTLLNGKANPWNDIVLTVGGEQILTGSLEQTASGFTAMATVDGETVSCVVDDAKDTATLTVGGESYTLTYGCTGKETQYLLQLPVDGVLINFELEIAPFRETVDAVSADGAGNLLEMSSDELNAFVNVIESIFS